jgi:RNA polymerase sigma factor
LENINLQAVRAAADKNIMEDFIKKHELFILSCASSVVKRYVTKSDDEWSVALSAFSQAVMGFSKDKGSFYSFAKIVIHRRLIDNIRKQSKHYSEISVSPSVFEVESEEEADNYAVKSAVAEKMVNNNDDSLKLEIESVSQVFLEYKFSFYDLISSSPKAYKTKQACMKAAVYIIKNPSVLSAMKKSRQLPVKDISEKTGVHRKIIERHRKYIVAAVEIITGDYPYLAEYVRFIREELNR